jgi:hypothetical protein
MKIDCWNDAQQFIESDFYAGWLAGWRTRCYLLCRMVDIPLKYSF